MQQARLFEHRGIFGILDRDAGLRGLLARSPGAWGPAQRLKCWSKDGNPASHGTVQLRLRKPSNAPQGQRIGGYGSVLRPGPMGLRRNKKLKTWLAGSQSGGIQAPGACGPGLQGAWGPGPQGLGPGPPGAWGLFPTKTTQTSQITIFSQTSWWEPGEGVGVG